MTDDIAHPCIILTTAVPSFAYSRSEVVEIVLSQNIFHLIVADPVACGRADQRGSTLWHYRCCAGQGRAKPKLEKQHKPSWGGRSLYRIQHHGTPSSQAHVGPANCLCSGSVPCAECEWEKLARTIGTGAPPFPDVAQRY